MSKKLTEQWKNGTLPTGNYYCKLYYNGFKEKIQECVKSAYSLKSCIPMSCGCEGEEVLFPVPTYDQFVELTEKVEKLTTKCNQLKEANEVIKHYADGSIYLFPTWCNGSFEANNYLEKWGVK